MNRESTDPTICEACQLIPLSIFALDYSPPITGWEAMLASRGVEIVADDLGRLSISREAARQLIADRAERSARMAEDARLRAEKRKPRPPVRGIPTPEGTGPNVPAVAVMVAADQERITVGPPVQRGESTRTRKRK